MRSEMQKAWFVLERGIKLDELSSCVDPVSSFPINMFFMNMTIM